MPESMHQILTARGVAFVLHGTIFPLSFAPVFWKIANPALTGTYIHQQLILIAYQLVQLLRQWPLHLWNTPQTLNTSKFISSRYCVSQCTFLLVSDSALYGPLESIPWLLFLTLFGTDK